MCIGQKQFTIYACLIFINVTIACDCHQYLIFLQIAPVAGYNVCDATDTRKQEQNITGVNNLQPAKQLLSLKP